MNCPSDTLILLESYIERWIRNEQKFVDEDGCVKRVIPEPTVGFSISVVGDTASILLFQELVSDFIHTHPDIVFPEDQ